jgi:2-polyprenyl-3-methyl-5-hydroxy-6-metoxy-1,4-benzoquinol methylase
MTTPADPSHSHSPKTLSHGEAELIASSTATEVDCPVCGSRNYAFYCNAPSHYGPESYRVTRCNDCSMVFTNPQFTFYDTIAETRGTSAEYFNEERLDPLSRQASFVLSLIRAVSGNSQPGQRLLDFGCGEGAVVGTALREGWDAKGYDLNTAGMEEANRYWKTNAFESGTFDKYVERHANTFDVVIALQVFEHLAHPAELGREIVKLLKPGGLFLIDVPNVRQLGEWRKKGSTLDPTAHLCHFSTQTLSPLMETLGCEVVYRSGAPSFFRLYQKFRLGQLAYVLGRVSKSILPPIGTGACVIGRKRSVNT